MSIGCLVGFLLVTTTLYGQDSYPPGWHKGYSQELQGANIEAAMDWLKARQLKPRKTVVVGIIDSGLDTTAVDILPALWTNRKEKVDGKDNDRNGYADDLHGWNFLGTADGQFNLVRAGTQAFREFKRLYPRYKNTPDSVRTDNEQEHAYYIEMKKKAGIAGYMKLHNFTRIKDISYRRIDSVLHALPALDCDTLKTSSLVGLPIDYPQWEQDVQTIFADLLRGGGEKTWAQLLKQHNDALALQRTRIESIENEPDKRLLLGDDPTNAEDRFYGNPILGLEDSEHGTFVAGVIAAQGTTHPQALGSFPAAKLMILRAVPDGDEYDKDIATAIRYAVDNGAKVINMSLGKYISPQPQMVTQAIAYAQAKDVLIVQAAGNDGLNIDSISYFPLKHFADKVPALCYLRVGASDAKCGRIGFSNYGVEQVDVFAPGVGIASVGLGNAFMQSQGTSAAAPVVSAVAAMLRAYFPKLKAAQVRSILMQSARPMPGKRVCASGGVIDALAAVKLALTYSSKS